MQYLVTSSDLFYYVLFYLYNVKQDLGLGLWCLTPLSGGGNRSTRRKPPTSRKSLMNFIT